MTQAHSPALIAAAKALAEKHGVYHEWECLLSFRNALLEALSTTPPETPEMDEPDHEPAFQREERYIVIKRKCLQPTAEAAIKRIASEHGGGTVECVVVERDWPEHETVWAMIEARCTGKAPPEPAQEAGESCATCRFRKPDERPEYVGSGQCRRFPPVAAEQVAFDGSGANHYSQVLPWMAADDWCGEYRAHDQ